MNKLFFALSFLVIALLGSCTQKQQKPLAIGVLLTIPKNPYEQAIQLNQAIRESQPDNITLDAHHIPHITLLQCYVNESDLPKIEQDWEGLYKIIENDSLWADHLQYNTKINESFASIGIKRSEPLMNLHKKVIALLEPYILPNGSPDAYVQNSDGTPIDEFTLAYVPNFLNDHSYENYNPHISLGVAKTSLLDSLAQHKFQAMKFQPTSISIYQLGAFGTAQKCIAQSK